MIDAAVIAVKWTRMQAVTDATLSTGIRAAAPEFFSLVERRETAGKKIEAKMRSASSAHEGEDRTFRF